MTILRLNDVFPDWLTTGGIFSLLQSLDVPWQEGSIATSLDLLYHGNRSGFKNVAPLIYHLVDEDNELSTANATKLATAIFNLYNDNWGKEFDTLIAQYNPIENYNMVEQMTNDITSILYGHQNQRTNNLSDAKTGTETTAPNLTNTETNKVFGFNSSSAVNDSERSVATTGSSTLTHNTTDAHTGTQTDTESGTDTHTRNYRLTRSGNIGVTTSQQMLQAERELYVWNFFNDVVFPDIDKILVLPIY